MANRGHKVKNIATSKPISASHASNIAETEIWGETFKSDYMQLRKIFSQKTLGLTKGSPPPRVE